MIHGSLNLDRLQPNIINSIRWGGGVPGILYYIVCIIFGILNYIHDGINTIVYKWIYGNVYLFIIKNCNSRRIR